MTPKLSSTVDPSMDSKFLPEALRTERYVRFGPFCIDQQRQQVCRNGSRLRLQGKVFQVLMVLLHKQGEVVSREELKQALWPADTHVNYDANVNTTVNKLRQALGESTDKPLYIETIPRKGYSFISTAEFSDAPFPVANLETLSAADGGDTTYEQQSAIASGAQPRNWITVLIILLILAGALIGAGAATFWISHFAPQIRHSASQYASPVSLGQAS
jgi:DNA-binding winged helix-turn-helix (wHTH) protein